MNKILRKAVFPVAGLGTRFLPATKAIPKEMLPIIDKPLIQYAVEEAIEAGIEQLIFITAASKTALENHFDDNPVLEQALLEKKDQKRYQQIKSIIPPEVSCVYIRQRKALGLGHAIWCSKEVVGGEPFAVLLADDLIDGSTSSGCLAQMHKEFKANQGGNIIAVEQIPLEQSSNYGVVKVATQEQKLSKLKLVTHIVEKPLPSEAPSDLGVVGRYILMPSIFSQLENLPKGSGNEIQLTDAIARAVHNKNTFAYPFVGKRFDCGQKQGFVEATMHYAKQYI